MAGKRQVIRRVERAGIADFDDQLWPINCALLVLAGFVSGIVIATSNFEGGPFWQNGYFRLALVAVGVVVLFAGTWWLHRRKHVRRMQLAVFLSLLLNLGLQMWLYRSYMYLFADADNHSSSQWIDEQDLITLPDYGREPTDQLATEDLERPAETITPDAQQPEVQREQTPQPPTPTQPTPTSEPAMAAQPAPASIDRAATAASVPRRSEQPSGSQVSRQTHQAPTPPTQSVPIPAAPTAAAARQTPLESRATPVERSAESQPELARRPTTSSPAASAEVTPRQLSRSTMPAADVARAAPAQSIARQTPQLPQQRPTTVDIQSAAPAPAAEAPASIASSAAAQATRQQAQAPSATPASTAPAEATASAAQASSPTLSRAAADTGPAPSAMANPSSIARTQPLAGSANAAAEQVAAPAAQATASTAGQLEASAATNVARASAAAPTNRAATAVSAGQASSAEPLSAASMNRAVASTQPGGFSATQAAQPGRAAVSPAASAVPSAAAEIPAAQVAEAGGEPALSANAQATTVARSSGAVPLPAGRGPSQPTPGEALNTARGLAQGTPRRAASSSDSRQAAVPGAGSLARSEGLTGSAVPTLAIPLEGPAAAGGLAGEVSTGPQAAAIGIARASGQAPAAAPGMPATAAGTSGALAAPAGAAVSRASGLETSAAAQSGTTAGALARSSPGAATLGAATTKAEELASAGSVATGAEVGTSIAPAAARVQRASSLPGALAMQGGTADGPAAALSSAAGGSAVTRADVGGAGPAMGPSSASEIRRQGTTGALPSGLAEADEPGPVASALASQAGESIGELDPAQVARKASGALPVEVAALDGPGSLVQTPSPIPGLPHRLARSDVEAIQQVAERFRGGRSGGLPSLDPSLFKPSAAYLQRAPEQRSETAKSRGGTAGSERAVEMGLDYLARQQLADGRWSLQHVAEGATGISAGAAQMQADTAATGLALLCFLGAGYTHTDGKYRDTVAAGVAHLMQHQKENGDLFSGGSRYVWLYSHGIASIALCEAYGMTADPQLREPAQKALDFILASQHPTYGGWRYAPKTSTDTSVSGWQIMALKSGELAGLSVPAEAYAKVSRWLDGAQSAGGSQYSYRPESQIPHQRNPSLAMTAEALLMRLYTGWPRTDPRITAGAERLRQNLPSTGTPSQPLRDAYYWYYATQVMFQVQGDAWNSWNERLRNLLTSSQVSTGPLAGSWDPAGVVPDRWGREAGRLYVTAMHLLMLEVYYRHLPLYQLD